MSIDDGGYTNGLGGDFVEMKLIQAITAANTHRCCVPGRGGSRVRG
jgi:hypothetical protein